MTECCCDDIIIEVNEEGVDGIGIASIELVSTVGITKNYRINLTNGTYFDYSISDGSSIASISKTSSVGLVDTYTVLLTSGDTTTFEVTNGNGIAGITKTSTDNLTDTYTISYTNGTTSTFSVVNGNSIASVSKVSTQVLTDTYQITYTDEDKSPDSFTVVNGRGIVSIAKTSTSGLVDTYTITYNDNSTSTYTVTNGMPATHEWNGTVLTITSASGTSSADLKGDKGDAATIAVGTVTTTPAGTNATITNSGDEHDAVFDFTIPRGNTGNGIASITLQSTSGLVKTYRVTYTDGEHYDFNVADGNGIASISILSESGATKTYRILFTDGTHFDYDVVDGSDEWGAIVGNLSDQTDLQNALDSKAPAITETASGSIASFTDGSTLPVESLTVSIEPVQDLHGYDNPWPEGGGKNLCNFNQIVTDIIDTPSVYLPEGTYYVYIASTNTSYNSYGYISTNELTDYVQIGTTSEGVDAYADQTMAYSKKKCIVTVVNPVYFYVRIQTNSELSGNRVRVMVTKDSTNYNSIANNFVTGNTYFEEIWKPYSNICPISGWTSATVTRTRKNLLKQLVKSPATVAGITFTQNPDGSITANGTSTNNANYQIAGAEELKPLIGKSLYFTGKPEGASSNVYLALYDTNYSGQSLIKGDTGSPITVRAEHTRLLCHINPSQTLNNAVFHPMFTVDPLTAYEPYDGTSVTISLGEERYGGTLDVTTGMLTVTKVGITFTGTENITTQTIGGYRRFNLYNVPYSIKGTTGYHSSSLYIPSTVLLSTNSINNAFWWVGTSIVWRDDSFGSAEDMKTELARLYSAGTPFQVVGELTTPITVQLTPSQMSTLLGENHIFADTGSIDMTYRADSKLYIDQQIAESQKATRSMITTVADSMVAPTNLTNGQIIIVGDDIYKLTTNISSGANLVVGTNCQKATLAEWVTALTA